MMRAIPAICILLLICGCARPIPDSGRAALYTADVVDPLDISRLLTEPSSMIMLAQFPVSDSISNITIALRINTEQLAPLTIDNFPSLLESAKALDPNDEKIRMWHYAPWHTIAFSGPDGQYQMSLFLGGRGFLLQPNGAVGPFEFEHPQ